VKNWALFLFFVYLAGLAITAGFFGVGLASGELHINSNDELGAMIAFCVFWPLTWAWIAFCFIVLVCLGWRGEPLRW